MSDRLREVRRAAAARRRAELAYTAALVAAVEALEQAGVRDAFAQVAEAAGVSRQAVRQLVARARG
jgi:hypothetical protein